MICITIFMQIKELVKELKTEIEDRIKIVKKTKNNEWMDGHK